MPQLKTRVYGVDGCDERPKHMLESMRIIAAAAFAEQWFGNILVGLSAEKGVRLAKQFNSLEGEAKKAASLEATATSFLEPDMHDLLHLVVKVYRSAMRSRNPFAHHRYGWSPDDEDIIMLIDPRHELVERAFRAEMFAKNPGEGAMPREFFDALEKASKGVEETIMCYRLPELESIRKSIEEATTCLTQFWQLIATNLPPQIRGEISEQLTQRLRAKGM